MPDFSDNLKPLYDGPAQLASERQRSNILAEELTKHLLSRNGFLDRQTRICNVLENDPLFNKSQQMNLSRPVSDKL
jgi:acyl-CoA oxidase